jgi:hypothetical protein
MARTLLNRQLTAKRNGAALANVEAGFPPLTTAPDSIPVVRNSRLQFALAARTDDAAIRALLRSNPMPGRISVTLEREPSFFSDAGLPGETKQTIVARENGRLVCIGSCVIRRRYVNGQPRRVGYLGGLRLDASHAGRFDILRRGYEFFRDLQADAPADFYFTSIVTDNARARRFLERGLPGMPRYEFIGDFVTVFVPATRRSSASSWLAEPSIIDDELVSHLNEHNRLHQLSPTWTTDELSALESLGLKRQDFLHVTQQGRVVASAVLWDQRSYKQTVIRGYAAWLGRARPALNFAASVLGWPQLPQTNTTLPSAFVSHLAVAADQPTALVQLLVRLRARAGQRKIQLLTLGFAANDPRLATLRKNLHCREYLTQLYLVHWPGIGNAACNLDSRVLSPEVALL